MQYPKIVLVFLLALTATGVQAQNTVDKLTTREEINAQPETYPATNFPYSGLTNFTMMEVTGYPDTEKTSRSSYIGVLGEKWETDKRGRRSTFIQHGQEMSVGYTIQNNEPILKVRPHPDKTAALCDSLDGKVTRPLSTAPLH